MKKYKDKFQQTKYQKFSFTKKNVGAILQKTLKFLRRILSLIFDTKKNKLRLQLKWAVIQFKKKYGMSWKKSKKEKQGLTEKLLKN